MLKTQKILLFGHGEYLQEKHIQICANSVQNSVKKLVNHEAHEKSKGRLHLEFG